MNTPCKIFSVQQVREADLFTLQQEPISSIDLMERAATKCCEWIKEKVPVLNKCILFCGHGNNGGDGLAMARILYQAKFIIEVYVLNMPGKYSDDFAVNKDRLTQIDSSLIKQVCAVTDFPAINTDDIVIDAIFGTGLSKPVTGLAAEIIHMINNTGATVIAIDIPSGLLADTPSDHSSAIVKATYTISLQFPKLAFFFAENAMYTGNWAIVNIGLSKAFIANESTTHYQLTYWFIKNLLKPRPKFSHKGTYGHAMLITGSHGKIGAAVLAARACLRSGVGLLTVHLPECGYEIMQATHPEAMVTTDTNRQFIGDEMTTGTFSAVGIGPGIGSHERTQKTLFTIIQHAQQPLVMDADALNILGLHKDWLKHVPQNSILTPHPKEFERLAGKAANDFERHEWQVAFSKKYQVFVVLKGAHTCITTPSGESYFNITGNPGMAKGGSGDVLTGIITGVLAQGYGSLEACLISVYVHGYAGDLASVSFGETGMTVGDICDHLPAAWKHLYARVN
jgi:hydroxyethylthiazole kinase-like uncharacterized protein yjeF